MSFCVLIPACHFCWSYICTPTSLTYFLWLVLLQKLCNSLFFHTLSQVEFFLQFRMPLIIIFSLHAVWAFGYILPKVPQSLSGILEVFVYWSIPYFLYKKVCLLLFCRKNLSIIICIYFHQIAFTISDNPFLLHFSIYRRCWRKKWNVFFCIYPPVSVSKSPNSSEKSFSKN